MTGFRFKYESHQNSARERPFLNSRPPLEEPLNPSFAKFRVPRPFAEEGEQEEEPIELLEEQKVKNSAQKYSTLDPLNPKHSPEEYTREFISFLDSAPTTYHVVHNVAKELEAKGFVYLPERANWEDKIARGTKFYTKRNDSTILAFVIGSQWKPGNAVAVIGSHIDALALRLKPISKKDAVDGFELLGVAPYAGALNPSWLDRDLGLGGRVIVRQGGSITSKLVHVPYPIAVIPTLAAHFGKPAEPPFNPETQLVPVTGLGNGEEDPEPTDDEKSSPLYGKHSLKLLRLVSEHLGMPVRDIIQFDLELFDTQESTVGGLNKDFVFGPRMDDKLCSFAAYKALIESLDTTSNNSSISAVALYDVEEIGSNLRQGAASDLFDGAIDRVISIYLGKTNDAIKKLTYANSFFISADVIHAVNPNFTNYYLEHHKPRLNVGPAISCDSNGHFTTDAVSMALAEEVARRSGDELQYFQIRNDSRSGGSIGPKMSTNTGMRAIDIGLPMLQMHSIRNTTGSKDVWLGVRYFKNFFEKWEEVNNELRLGDL